MNGEQHLKAIKVVKDYLGSVQNLEDDELKYYCDIAMDALSISEDEHGTNIDTLVCLYRNGPCEDGDVPAKSERDWLLEKDYCAKIVVKKEDGYQALNYKGNVLINMVAQIKNRPDFLE